MVSFYERNPTDYPLSRYRSVKEIVVDPGRPYLDFPNIPAIPETDQDRFIIVGVYEENRLDRVSYVFYNNVVLWWVIAHVNEIMDPLNVPVGTRLRIPPLSVLHRTIGVLA